MKIIAHAIDLLSYIGYIMHMLSKNIDLIKIFNWSFIGARGSVSID